MFMRLLREKWLKKRIKITVKLWISASPFYFEMPNGLGATFVQVRHCCFAAVPQTMLWG